jgi:hypothetical protein
VVQLCLQARGRSDCCGQETCAVVQLVLQAHGRSDRCGQETCAVVQLVLQARGKSDRTVKTVPVETQLRLQARSKSARCGLAGTSRACKHCSGLALSCSGGEHPHARGRVASNNAREHVLCQTPRGGLKSAVKRRLDEGCYWGKRERERERCVSAADASTYGRALTHSDPRHNHPQRTHAKT